VAQWLNLKPEDSHVTMSHFAYSGKMMKKTSGKIAIYEYTEWDDIFPKTKPAVRKNRFQSGVDR